ncbi:MAG: hypothetical protein UH249_10235 [Acutalibacteraceae bacterium]|nr:hypothetical protein [Acutalibacteraceae bacterium]
MNIDFNAFLSSLPYMGKGMLGIFIVTALIVLVVNALNNIPEKKSKKNKEEK